MTPDQERKLDGVCVAVGRIDERTQKMDEYHQREIQAAHARMTEIRQEAAQDVKDLRGEVKRLSGIISAAISAVVAGIGQAFGLGGGS